MKGQLAHLCRKADERLRRGEQVELLFQQRWWDLGRRARKANGENFRVKICIQVLCCLLLAACVPPKPVLPDGLVREPVNQTTPK